MAYLSGKTGSVLVNGVAYPFDKWKLSITVGKPKVTNFKTSPYQALVSGILAGKLSLEGPYDAGNMPLTGGNEYVFTLGWTVALNIQVQCIVDLDLSNDVEQNPKVSISGESDGSFGISIV